MPKLRPYPFWIKGGTQENAKLPKVFRRGESLTLRMLKSTVRDIKTGEYKKRTYATKDT